MEKRIKIFVDAHSFDTEFQGTQTFIHGLYSALLKDHPELDIYFGAYYTDRIQKVFPLVDASRILSYKKRRFSFLRFFVDIPALIKKHSFDYAHFQYVAPLQIIGCKYIVTVHDALFNDFPKEFTWLYRCKRNFIFKKSIRQAAIKTTVSDYSRNRIAAHYNIGEAELHVIHNGVSIPSNYNKEKTCQYLKEKYGVENFILNVSRIEPRKNHLLLLSKYLELQLYTKNISLVFIGKRSVKVIAVEKKIASLTKEQKAFFYWIEQVDVNELPMFYQACKLFVYPSKAEGFGIPPLEAAVNKVPVLCANTTAMHDFKFFEPYTFDPNNEVDFENKLKNILTSPLSFIELEKIEQQVIQQYSWQKSAAILFNLIQSAS
jgi:glycosyltransferase involved in cell wall biosynthesis